LVWQQFNAMRKGAKAVDQSPAQDCRNKRACGYQGVVCPCRPQRQSAGWASSTHMPAQLVVDALHMAICTRQPPPGLIVHSDRGSQYASHLHQALLADHSLTPSMSRKGNCWDNPSTRRVAFARAY